MCILAGFKVHTRPKADALSELAEIRDTSSNPVQGCLYFTLF